MPLWSNEILRRWQRRWSELSYGQQRMFQTLAILAIVAVGAPPLYLAARPLANRWRHRQALAQAAAFERQEDYRNLVLALHRAVQIAPDDVATWRWVARTLDKLGATDALVAHENVVALTPGDSQARAALAAAALRFDAPDTARTALRDLERDPAQREAYLRLAAELARTDDDVARYEELLAALADLRPDDSEVRFNLAVLQLAHSSPARHETSRAALEKLLDDPRVRVRAALQLLNHAAQRRDAALAGAITGAIITRCAPGAAMAASANPWPVLVQTLQRAATAQGDADIARVARWLGTIRRAPEGLAWLDSLSEKGRAAPAVRDVAGELAARADDLPRLQSSLVAGAWGPVVPEGIQSAVASRADRLARRDSSALTRWQEAVRYAEQSAATLRALARLARIWRDDSGLEAAAKAALRLHGNSPWANRELRDLYFARGETAKLLAHYASWIEFEPNRPALVFAWVRAGAALDRVNDAMDQRTRAMLAAPDAPPAARLARALVLWRRKQPLEAAQILAALPPCTAERFDTLLVRALVEGEPPARRKLSELPPGELFTEERISLKLPALPADLGS